MSQKLESQVQSAYSIAKERYAALGVDTEAALTRLETIPSACTAGRVMT